MSSSKVSSVLLDFAWLDFCTTLYQDSLLNCGDSLLKYPVSSAVILRCFLGIQLLNNCYSHSHILSGVFLGQARSNRFVVNSLA
jgi:hypothetical protein